jgi:glycine cleavage system transcriptional repressor
MNRTYAVISAIGTDRVGIVDELSELVTQAGANIEESKMAVLGGDFAVMMLVSQDAKAFSALESASAEIERKLGLKVGLKPTAESASVIRGRPYSLETVSLDGQGIVHSVSAVLHRFGVNIEELETRTEGAPLTGAPLFRLKASVVLGPEVPVAALRKAFEELRATEDLDISLAPLLPGGCD